MNEEQRLLQATVRKFVEQELAPAALRVEREGIGKDLLRSLASLGLLGALAPPEYGGAALDRLSYVILLHEVSRVSPSVGFYLLLQNSLVVAVLARHAAEREKENIARIAEGKLSGTLVYSEFLRMMEPGRVELSGGRVEGRRNGVLNSSADLFLTRVEPTGGLFLLGRGFRKLEEHERLGFRGLTFSPVEFSLEADGAAPVGGKGGEALVAEALEGSTLASAAVALGIAEGALERAIGYAKEREAFAHKLKDFQPLAFGLSRAAAELESLREYLFSVAGRAPDLRRELMAKELAVDFARRAAKLSLQVHGGYGYMAEVGVEKFYRDAMFLSAVSGDVVGERRKLSELVFNAKAGFV